MSVKLKFFAVFIGLWTLFCGAAQAAGIPAVKNLQFGYSIYVGGIHALDVAAQFSHVGVAYKITMKTGTEGVLRNLAPWDADLVSAGRLTGTATIPTRAVISTWWKEKPSRVDFTFRNRAIAAKFTPVEGDNNEPVPDALKRGVLDPLSAAVQIMANVAAGKGCEQKIPVYDGHRRFDLNLHDDGDETVDGEDYSIYSGRASRCIVDFTMLAGSRKDREGSHFWEDNKRVGSGKPSRPPVYVYLAKVRDDLPELPVRAETSTFFGNIVIHLTRLSGGNGKSMMLAE